jgi:fructokinase
MRAWPVPAARNRRSVRNPPRRRPTDVTPMSKLLAGVELGGTKCVCILGTGPDDVRAIERLPTGEREQTLRQIEGVLDRWRQQHGAPRALGIASFGPVDLRPSSRTQGYITSTTKPGWRNTDVAQRLARRLGVPVGFDTDVNGAALAEGRWGAASGLSDFAYVTVGTGIGVGSIVRGRSVFGMNHTELGHIRVVRKEGDDFPGTCPFHGDCIEGLASGPAIEARAGKPGSQIAPDDPAWDFVAHGLAQLLHTMVLTTAPQRIFLGGGVMAGQPHLFGRIRRELQLSLNGYVEAPQLGEGIDEFIVAPGLGTMAGPLGALALAADAESHGVSRSLTQPAAAAL